jgi:starch synthase (maltosyl-transferring)
MSRLLGELNRIRAAHPALRRLRNLSIHPTSDDATVCFSRRAEPGETGTDVGETVLVVLNLDAGATREGVVYLDFEALGLTAPPQGTPAVFDAYDELTGEVYAWGTEPFVRLDPWVNPAHIIHVRARG